ncbi:MAG: SufD family Fe-S cluster assembly protein [Rhodobacteraceae bacterium]|nr:SufD family Fe-S cluster assembly protein [Paracoccaceae bacterium]MCB1408764.1 SufD family Fe-S cluster assembly protein [Paracoccaceae bacterium]
MNAHSPRAQRLAARRAATQARIDTLSPPAAPAWAAPLRAAAFARLADMGLPEKRDEYWRYTDPARLTAASPPEADVFRVTDEPAMYEGVDRLKLVFTDGVFDADASDPVAGEGIEISRLAEAADTPWSRDLYGALEARAQAPVPRPMAALNTAMATDGVLIRVTGVVSRPVSVIYRRTDPAAEATLHHLLRLEEGAELTLLENGPVAARSSIVIEADLADRAVLHHIRTMGRDHQRIAVTHLFARLGADARLKSFTLSMNGALVRNEAMLWLDGKGGVAHVAGAALGDGAFHHDDTVFIAHRAPGCESRQVFKKVLRTNAIGVFQGKILVERAAQLTDGYQISQSLLLDERSQFLAKPELEIYADDVKCSHGSTSGEIDADHLFYLRARGVPEDEAKLLLVLAFLAEALDEIERGELVEDMQQRLRGWLERHSH